MSTAVAKTENRPIDMFRKQMELAAPTIMKLVPAHVSYEKFKSMVITTVAYNPKLLECSTASLLRETAMAADVGLSLNPTLKEADILPVWGKDGSVAQFRPRYGGLMKLARQSGEIIDIYAHEVYENDFFEYEQGLDKKLVHRPASGDRGKITHAYVVWQTKFGIKSFEVLDRARLDRARDASEGYKAFKAGKIKSTPWDTDEGEMCRKTAVKAGSKYMPQSSESFLKALAADRGISAAEELPELLIEEPRQISEEPAVDSAKSQLERIAARVANVEEEETQDTAQVTHSYESVANDLRKALLRVADQKAMGSYLAANEPRLADLKTHAPDVYKALWEDISAKERALRGK